MKELDYYKQRKPFRKIDWLVLTVGLIVFCLGFLFLLPQKGNTVIVTYNGSEYGSYALTENRVLHLDCMDIVIENGCVKVTRSNCANKLCELQGEITSVHQSIVCAPNRVVIQISGKSEYDGIVGGAL